MTSTHPTKMDDGAIARWDARYAAEGHGCAPEPNPWIQEITGALTPGRAIDVAAGTGRHALWLAGRGWTVRAIDFSPVAIELGRAAAMEQGLAERMEWVEADVTALELEPRSADLVLLAFLHLDPAPWRAVLSEAADAVATGGGLLVVGHDRTNRGTGTPGPTEPKVLYSVASLAGDLQRSGMRIELAEVRSRANHHQPDGAQSADTVLFARRV